MSSVTKSYYTPEQYLELEREAAYKSEYVDGQIYAMSGASRAHNRITLNIGGAMNSQFGDGPCEAFATDMRVKVSSTGIYTYPDIVAVCGEPHFEDAEVDTLTNPTVVIEVLSPSTEAYDRGAKFANYRESEGLTDYVLVSKDRVMVEHFSRGRDGSDEWVLKPISDLTGNLRLASVGCELPLTVIYRRVILSRGEIQIPGTVV